MINHRLKAKKPFQIGQLVECKTSPTHTLCLILDLEWDSVLQKWWGHFLFQPTGLKEWYPTKYFEPAEKNDD